ncbi:MAG: hypothetical protein JNJ61_10700 [Anaerolineae bacterium]|nr:hypothetical protein [Anaerolineae bacterium]
MSNYTTIDFKSSRVCPHCLAGDYEVVSRSELSYLMRTTEVVYTFCCARCDTKWNETISFIYIEAHSFGFLDKAYRYVMDTFYKEWTQPIDKRPSVVVANAIMRGKVVSQIAFSKVFDGYIRIDPSEYRGNKS